MITNANKLKQDCPKELKKDIEEIVSISKRFLENLNIVPNQNIEEVKIQVQEAKNELFKMISRFITLISENLGEEETNMDLGYRLKFSEDMGNVVYGLRERGLGALEKLSAFTKLLSYAGELLTLYDFIIYQPIYIANRSKTKNIKEYIHIIFKMVRVNVSILGTSEKGVAPLQLSKFKLPSTSSLMQVKRKDGEQVEEIPRGVDLATDYTFDLEGEDDSEAD